MRHYFDYAASTPVDPRVLAAMRPYFTRAFGNPGSVHAFGQEAVAALDVARETVARALGAQFREIIFTSSATEANNLILRGFIKSTARHAPGIAKPKIIVSAIEHESVLETVRDLENEGAETVIIPVDRRGVVNMRKLQEALDERTALVSVIHGSNEIGTIQPIAEISRLVRSFKEELVRQRGRGTSFDAHSPFSRLPLLHTDASQSFPYLDCGAGRLGADFMTLSSHKMYGPKGAGALFLRQATSDKRQVKTNGQGKINSFMTPDTGYLTPLLTGGGQEYGLRSGTENVPAIVGFAEAVLLTAKNREKETRKLEALKEYFWRNVRKIAPKARVNGVEPGERTSLPHIINAYFPGHPGQDLLTKLDLAGISASAGSACSARSLVPSYVIQALGYSKERAAQSVRFSFGRPTTAREVKVLLGILKKVL